MFFEGHFGCNLIIDDVPVEMRTEVEEKREELIGKNIERQMSRFLCLTSKLKSFFNSCRTCGKCG